MRLRCLLVHVGSCCVRVAVPMVALGLSLVSVSQALPLGLVSVSMPSGLDNVLVSAVVAVSTTTLV